MPSSVSAFFFFFVTNLLQIKSFWLCFLLFLFTCRGEDDPSVHQVHGLWHFPPKADVSGDIQLLVSMLQQQPMQLGQRSYHGNASAGPDGLPAECLLVLAVKNRYHSAILKWILFK